MNVKIFSWNINGIRAISKKNVFEWVDKVNPTILFLQEIKSSEEKVPKLFKNEYKEIIINSGKLKNQSGVLSYSNLSFSKIDYCKNVDPYDEGRIIKMKYENIYIFNIYVPNGKVSKERLKYKLEFYKKLLSLCKELIKKGYSIIICGDLNIAHRDIDLKKTKIHNKNGFTEIERKYLNSFFDIGFY